MAITFIATATADIASATISTVGKPTGTLENDIMFALYVHDASYATTIPSGWIKLAENKDPNELNAFQLFYKVAGGSEPSDYTWGFTSGGNKITIATYRGGFNVSSPIDVVSNTLYNTVNTTCRAASMTVTSANSALLFFAQVNYNAASRTFTKPSIPTTGWVEDYDSGSFTSDKWQEICSMVWASNGATNDIDATINSSTVYSKHAFAVALNPIAAAGPTNLKSYNTNLKANIKSINGNLIANVKSLDTNI